MKLIGVLRSIELMVYNLIQLLRIVAVEMERALVDEDKSIFPLFFLSLQFFLFHEA